MPETECASCGVAFDVGLKHCVEEGCRFNGRGVVAKPPKPTYKPSKNHVDKNYARHNSARQRAKRKGLPFDMTIEFVKHTIESPCVYCLKPGPSELDRKDNLQGYTQKNVAPACRRCNTIKNNVATYEEMMFIAEHLGWRK